MSTKVICQTPEIGLHIIDHYSKRSMEIVDKIEGEAQEWYVCFDYNDGTTYLRTYDQFDEIYCYE